MYARKHENAFPIHDSVIFHHSSLQMNLAFTNTTVPGHWSEDVNQAYKQGGKPIRIGTRRHSYIQNERVCCMYVHIYVHMRAFQTDENGKKFFL